MVMLRAAILLSIMAMSVPAMAADEQQWGFFGDDVDLRLFYGVPESDVTTLNIICQPKRKRIDFVNFVLPPRPRLGATLKTRLSNGQASLEYQGKVGRDRTHGVFYVEARPRFNDELFNFLGTGSVLTVAVERKRGEIPLKGISEPLGMMRQACLGQPAGLDLGQAGGN
jgi:hypothetical protein